MNLIGIVGKSNTGKSTFFKALTLADAEISNRIFTTIKPNQGVGSVVTECPCKKLGVKCNPQNSKCMEGKRLVPVKLVDVAGLVPDAHKGRGLGNQFLSDIMEAAGLINVIDASGGTDSEGNPVDPGSHDPKEDISFLPGEIDYWMLGILMKNWAHITKRMESTKEKIEDAIFRQLSGLMISPEDVKKALKEVEIDSKSDEEALLEFITELRKISKPVLIAANKIDLPEAQNNFEKIKGNDAVPCSAESELALREAERHSLIEYIPGEKDFKIKSDKLDEKQKQALEFIRKNVLIRYGSTGVQECLNKLVFEKLGMITVYPVADIGKLSDKKGNILPDAFLVKKGTTLREFASKIHTDLAESFIGGLDLDRKKIGAEHELKDGDVVEILFKG